MPKCAVCLLGKELVVTYDLRLQRKLNKRDGGGGGDGSRSVGRCKGDKGNVGCTQKMILQ